MGKTELCLTLADLFHTPIISADSRQMYADIPICTAAPTPAERERVEHYLVGNLSLDDYYSAARYEEDVMSLANKLFAKHDILLVTGGSMMYIDALCYGIDQIPTIPDDIRKPLLERYEKEGLEPLVQELRILDPVYYKEVDRRNPKRVIHALEVCYLTGHPYSDLRKGQKAERPFRIIRIGLTRPREELYERINRRVDKMVENGLIDEARRMYPRKGLNSLNTVGMKEMFAIFDGTMDRHTAIERMKKNTRVYAKKQLTWYRRDPDITWVTPGDAVTTALQLLNLPSLY